MPGYRWGVGVAGWQEMGLQGGWRLVNDGENGVSLSRGWFCGPATSGPVKIGRVECLLKILSQESQNHTTDTAHW